MEGASQYLVFGGRHYADLDQRPAWNIYEAGIALKIEDGVVVQRLEYDGNAIDRETEISVCLRAGCVAGPLAFTCTNTEVVGIDIASLTVVERWTHRYFNDLHHVTMDDGRFYVAATGIDSVLEFDREFALLHRYPTGTDANLERFGADRDFRRLPSAKPNEVHTNYVARWGDGLWATNLAQRNVRRLDGDFTVTVADAPIHDGVPAFGSVWFTVVKGAVVQLDPVTKTTVVHDLRQIGRRATLLGWCRGIAPVSPSAAVVGFSKLRWTADKKNLSWLDRGKARLKSAMQADTRIALYDFAARTEVWQMQLADEGMDAVFSIHPLDQRAS